MRFHSKANAPHQITGPARIIRAKKCLSETTGDSYVGPAVSSVMGNAMEDADTGLKS